MKILFLAPHLSTGGMPQFLLKRIETLKKNPSNDIYVVEYECYSLDYVVQRNAIKSLLGENFSTLGNNKMELLDIIKSWNPDIIHIDEMSERLNEGMVDALYDKDRKYRIVETCHDVSFNPNSKLFHPDLYIFCTPYHEETFADLRSKYVTIEYPIHYKFSDKKEDDELAKKLGINTEKTNVLSVGLWTPGKNQAEGIEIARKYPDFDFHFIGNQAVNFKEYWEPLMCDLPSNVKVWGERNDVDDFMRVCDIFMFNSTNECNPLVLREAIGRFMPIIARNLPQYGNMFGDVIKPIYSDLNTLDLCYPIGAFVKPYQIEDFPVIHEESYAKVLSLPAQSQDVIITQNFINGPFLEIKGKSKSDFKVKFIDEKGKCHYESTIKSNSWVRLNRKHYTRWTAKVYENGRLIYTNTMDLQDKNVFIVLDSKSLGDTIAWTHYALYFQNKHKCKVILSTFWNHILDYPELTLVEPGTRVNCYALYTIGWHWNKDKEPTLCNTIPLQQAATNILGLEFEERRPKLKSTYQVLRHDNTPYVTIATNSTMECKFWTREGWQEVINFLVERGYKVINVSKEDNPFDNCDKIQDTSIRNTMDVIAGSELFIGLSSGLSWLAWALYQKVVMISNFTEEDHEFSCYRVTKPDVCNSCWNDPNIRLDPFWSWCPRNKNFECQRTIPASMVIDKIKEAGF